MAVTRRTNLIIMTADADTVDLGVPIYIKYVAFETCNVSEAANFDLRDATAAASGVNIVPLYAAAADGTTPPAQFAVEGYVNSQGLTLEAVNVPTGGRIFIYTGKR